MSKFLILLLMCQSITFEVLKAQDAEQHYSSYLTGKKKDKKTRPKGGICLMGGGSENVQAMKWFVERANGGDILVLRASGSDGYNSFLYDELGIAVNSVESIVFHSRLASYDPKIHQKINQAEAIWIAGGDQWNYVNYWKNSPVDSLINHAIVQKNIAIGGTSAGMAVLGQYYFSAQNGTITSEEALSDPSHPKVNVETSPFFQVKHLNHVITDTHFDERKRKGRMMVFLSRLLQENKTRVRGIACDENTAVCIGINGIAHTFGNHPTQDDHVYFIQVNTFLNDPIPEQCTFGIPLTWNKNGSALKVYKVPGTMDGKNYFNLVGWNHGSGGKWLDWSTLNGMFYEKPDFDSE